ncbi:Fructose-2,6-bisphosphatase [Coemansia sp. RSA 1365]|nr:Fructose-2,6-bisphosphatase [Coemansia sp. RSA 1365]
MLAGGTRIVVVMVGLPARGKTYISYKVSRYLAWLGVNCRVFNVGEYRRKLVGAKLDHTFFDPHNAVAISQRLNCATLALQDMFEWFEAVHSGVAIYDATNSTRSRRKMIMDECSQQGVDVMFCESWCDDSELIDLNIREVKRTSPDYKGVKDIESVIEDFRRRIDHYSEVYEPVGGDGTRPLAKGEYPLPPTSPTIEDYDEQLVSYVRKINVGSRMVINRITSYLESRIVYFMMNIHIAPRSVLFSRHGESLYNLDQRLGGDPGLSPNGRKYAEALPGLISRLLGDEPLTIWTSTLKRTAETAAGLPYKKLQWKALDELEAGLCDGLTYEDVEREYPEEYAMRDENKFEFRYRGGESYRDVVLRLEPVIMELERQQNIMIISHQAVLRCIYAYFLDIGPEELPYLKIPLHTVMKLTWTAYGCDIQMYKIDIDAVDTHRAKPKTLKRGGTIKGMASCESSNVSRPDSATPAEISRPTATSPPAKELLAVRSIKRETEPRSPNAVSDTWDVDKEWEPSEDVGSTKEGSETPLPTPPVKHNPPSVHHDSLHNETLDTDAMQSALQAADISADNAAIESATPVPGMDIEGVKSKLSISGGHEQGICDGHNAGHVWPSQISPSETRRNSRVPTPVQQLSVDTSGKGSLPPTHSYPGRSNPRNGSPVYLSPGDFATSFEMHQLCGKGGGVHSRSHSLSPSPAMSDPTLQHTHQRHPRLANQKIDQLHVAGHGDVDIVETTPTITLRYSSNIPANVRKETAALRNELVGIENEDTASDDSSSERASCQCRDATGSVATQPTTNDVAEN